MFRSTPSVVASGKSAVISWWLQPLLLDVFISMDIDVTNKEFTSNDAGQVAGLNSCLPERPCTYRFGKLLPCTQYQFDVQLSLRTKPHWTSSYRTENEVPVAAELVSATFKQGLVLASWKATDDDVATDDISFHVRLLIASRALVNHRTTNSSASWHLNITHRSDDCQLEVATCNRCGCSTPVKQPFVCSSTRTSGNRGGSSLAVWLPILIGLTLICLLILVVVLCARVRLRQRPKPANTLFSNRIEVPDHLYDEVMGCEDTNTTSQL